jgi:hypothetical protein
MLARREDLVHRGLPSGDDIEPVGQSQINQKGVFESLFGGGII